jgi:hypothetical protein
VSARATAAGALVAAALLAAGCGDRHGEAAPRVAFPGQLSASGGTSGEVMRRAASAPTATAAAGTPGIPEGSGGNTSGVAMGGTSPGAAANQRQTETGPSAASAPAGAQTPASAPPAMSAASAAAQREKDELERAMDTVAQRWRARQAPVTR